MNLNSEYSILAYCLIRMTKGQILKLKIIYKPRKNKIKEALKQLIFFFFSKRTYRLNWNIKNRYVLSNSLTIFGVYHVLF